MTFCTLFDSNYADKGRVLIKSLIGVESKMKIYVLCMDELCYLMLCDLPQNVIRISLDEFLDEDLREARQNRSNGEFCWTCTAKLIKYVLMNYDEEDCTYLDSDLFFYSSPKKVLDEMYNNNKEVIVVPHRFPDTRVGRLLEQTSGKNCVQFNTFIKKPKSLSLLDKWIKKCLVSCKKETGGDQLYITDWGEKDYVYSIKDEGVGLAPWNITKYQLFEYKNNEIMIRNRYTNVISKLVFYHFQGIEYIDRYTVKIGVFNQVGKKDKKLIYLLYGDYLKRIEEEKIFLEKKYDFCPIYSHSTGLNADRKKRSIKVFLQDNKSQSIRNIIKKVIERINIWLQLKNDLMTIK